MRGKIGAAAKGFGKKLETERTGPLF